MAKERIYHTNLIELFGMNVFDDNEMKARLPKEKYEELKRTIDAGGQLSSEMADIMANAMKEWAVEKGATHYTHWFQPLTGVTAEKHEAFITPGKNGEPILKLSGKALVQGEPDASSFPSGGLRATFEARGYTAWDYGSPAFLKEDISGVTLCIPTAFCSYNGEALDEKTPLLRSSEAINKQTLRLLRVLGDNETKRVYASAGAEQEYFLINQELFNKRMDLVFTGRTLFGARPAKSQEMESHYYGAIKERISIYMKELDCELWKMGVYAKTKHNEAAPAQHELAPVFTNANIATDQNQLIMETMKKVANRHGLSCLLHEKPFSYINGSGKHNNWSIVTDSGKNLLDGKNETDPKFLLILCSIVMAIDRHATLLRESAATPGNDLRLGACEAPPAIISIYLGSKICGVLDRIERGEESEKGAYHKMQLGAPTLSAISSDFTDRNRTSPFAFTSNRFEFRMLPSSISISSANVVLNTIVAEAFDEVATRLENASDVNAEILNIIREIYKKHKRVIFNGNGYCNEWVEEAEKRGLPNITNMVDAIPVLVEDDTVKMFEKYRVYSKNELFARKEIKLKEYMDTIFLEASTMLEMTQRLIFPAAMKYQGDLARNASHMDKIGVMPEVQRKVVIELEEKLSAATKAFDILKADMDTTKNMDCDSLSKSKYYRDVLVTDMANLRTVCDALERIVGEEYWPYPRYNELLFNI